ncbi:transglutaminase-like domain-containing protein [Nocardioides sp.]|uniref:transglutaminase-like domain-containing protein n=1 Tax=Nocardioides sp. TaxID=35761 RepID=UPI00286E2B22|nr:transglutaminase-like domain-containing protein [Nocardioides sp.]
MSHSPPVDTVTRARRRRQVLPDGATTLDLLFVLLLSGLALSGLATSFTGWGFLVVGLTGVVLAILVTHTARALGWPLIAPMVIVAALFFALGGPLCLRSLGDTAFLPGGSTLGALADQAIFGWKDMLTTLPPVDGDGPLLVLPWLLGLLAGLMGTTLSEVRLRRGWVSALLPVAGMTVVLIAVILLGVRHPQSVLVQGSVFGAAALGWLAIRARRASAMVHGGSSGRGRAVLGAALVLLASALAMPASALVTGGDDEGRAVARTWVEPPFDIGRYPSPLAGFRKYIDLGANDDPANVYTSTLFTIDGAPAGSRLRIAAMDTYDGMVWGASNDALPGAADDSFQRVSSTIDNPVEGKRITATVTIGEGYDGVWLPTIGALQGVDFRLGDPSAKSESFRYNLATSTAVVPSGVHRGDTYSFTAVQPNDVLTEETLASTALSAAPPGTGFLKEPATDWAEKAATPMGRVLAIAEHLKREGRYSDGVVKAEQVYHPGHHLLRLSDGFINDQQMVGNDEQYAAVMALLAGEVGVPARVVLGAIVPDDGVITGEDVQAWVELRAADGSWRTLPTEQFMSTEPPAEQLPETNTPMSGTVVPPPAPIPPPSDAGDQSDAELKERKASKDDENKDTSLAESLPAWVVLVATYVGGPLLLLAAILVAIIGIKVLRRRRRRSAASVSARFVGAWRELVDHARDLGQPVPLGPTVTRREQSGSIGSESAPALARRADSFVFGPRIPEASAAETYWESVDSERKVMSHSVGRRRRWLATISVASLRRGTMVPSAASEPAAQPVPGTALRTSPARGHRLPRLPTWPRLPGRARGGKRRSS